MKKLLSVLSLSMLLFISCKSDSTSTTNNNNGGNNAGTNQVLATIDGKAMTWTTVNGVKNGSYAGTSLALSIAAVDSTGNGIGIAGGGFVTTGTSYDLGTPASTSQLYAFAVTYTTKNSGGESITYAQPDNNTTSEGKISFSSITQTGAKGTFNGTIPLKDGPAGSPASVTITNGAFNVTF